MQKTRKGKAKLKRNDAETAGERLFKRLLMGDFFILTPAPEHWNRIKRTSKRKGGTARK